MKYFILLFSLTYSLIASSQVVDKTEEKAKKKTNQRVDKKIDQQLDKGLDAIEGLFGKKKKKNKDKEEPAQDGANDSPNMSQMGSVMGMMNATEIDRTYDFDHNFKLKIENYKKEKLDSEMIMKMYINEKTSSMGVKLEGEEAEQLDFMIYDMKENEMLTMMNNNGQKMGMLIKTDPPEMEENEVNDDIAQVRFEKTGNSKTISGFNCDEYQIIYENPEDEEGEQYFWITEETDADWIKSMSEMAAYSPNMPVNYGVPDSYPDGSVIQMVHYTENQKEKSIVTVMELNMNKSYSHSTKGYKFMEMPATQGGAYEQKK